MNERVLFVDDEAQILRGIQLSLRHQVELQVASSGSEGLRLMEETGPFALVISDMRMPVMSGTQFLAQVHDRHPDTVRMILSGHADFSAVVDAVNAGHIYRFLSKPCLPDQLLAAIADGLKQSRLLSAEKLLLEQTLSGCVAMLIEILGMVSPNASSRASRLQRYTLEIVKGMGLPSHWEWGFAAYVSQIGCVALPSDLLSKVDVGEELSGEEQRLYESHPEVAGKLLAPIPRLEDVADIVSAQFRPLTVSAYPADFKQWDVRSAGRLLLRVVAEFDRMTQNGGRSDDVAGRIAASMAGMPLAIVDALRRITPIGRERVTRQVKLKDLRAGMILDEELLSPKGIRLVPAGHEVTRSLIVRLTSIASGVGICEPFRVLVPK